MRQTRFKLRKLVAVVLVAAIFYSGYRLIFINDQYTKEAKLHQKLIQYRKDSSADLPAVEGREADSSTCGEVTNQGIIDMQKVNPDVTGWLTVDGTGIDYPFVYAKDYEEYLRTDCFGDYSIAGSIFMDYRCDRDFTSFNTIIYGHNMNNGSMFGTLKEFEDRDFFNTHTHAAIALANRNLQLELVSYMIVKTTDSTIYRSDYQNEGEKTQFLEKLQGGCVHQIYPGTKELSTSDHFVTLSSCAYHFSQARTVAIYRISE